VLELRASIRRLAFRVRWFGPLGAALRVDLGRDVRVEGRVWLPGPGRVRIGNDVRLLATRSTIELRAHEGGEIVLEDGVVIEDGTSIEATSTVRIGARTRIGPFCKIMDNHFHSPTADHRLERPKPVPVIVGPDVVLGPRAVLLPGAEVGANALLGPASVLSFKLPAGATFPGPIHA
jgi:acetyltransferase-like isoleucine patch superfamily enzyme